MKAWEAIFPSSRVNAGYYDEERLPQNRWEWPRGTWFQLRRDYLRQKLLLPRQKNEETRRKQRGIEGSSCERFRFRQLRGMNP